MIKYGVNDDGTVKEDYDLNINVVFFVDGSDDGGNTDPSFGSYNAFVDKDNNLFITWLQPIKEEDGSTCQEIYASAFIRDEEGSCWSDGVRLTHSGIQNDEVAFLIDNNGDLLTVSNQYKVDLTDETPEAEDVKLIAANYKTVGSLDVTGAGFADTTPPAGSENEVTISIKNTGLKNAKGYTMDIYEKVNGAVGKKLDTITSDETITPSSTVSTAFTWTMPESYEGVEDLSLYITVNEKATSEISEFTSDSIDIRPEYNITSCEATESFDGFYLTYTLENTGNADAAPNDEGSADKLKVECNDIYYKSNKPKTYLEIPIAGLAVGETQTNTMRLDIPEEKFEFGYSEAYMVVKNKDDKTVSNYEPFRLMLEYPYNISINGESYISRIEMNEGESLELSTDYSPKEFYSGGTVKYSVADTSVASVEGNTLTAEAAGETELTAIVEPYGGYKTVTVAVRGEGGSDDLVTREQAAAMMWRYAKHIGADASENTDILSYTDSSRISEYAVPALQWACGSGIIKGYTNGTLLPKNDATRAEMAAIIERFDKLIKQ